MEPRSDQPIMKPLLDLLLVDDDAGLRSTMAEFFEEQGHRVQQCGTGEAALELVEERAFDVVVLDLAMPGCSGIDVLKELRNRSAECEVVVLTGEATVESAVEAMKLGARDYLTKPIRLKELDRLVRKAYEAGQLRKENRQLKAALRRQQTPPAIIGKSAPMQEVFRLIRRVGPTDKPILIQGESGTGKELVARALHDASPLADKPLITVNCAALHGHVARKRAVRSREGVVHRRGRHEAGAVRSGRRRHVVHRRNRRVGPRSAGQAAARAGRRFDAPRRFGQGAARARAADCGHESRLAAGGQGKAIPRRPVLPDQRADDSTAAAPAAQGRFGIARGAFFRAGLADRPQVVPMLSRYTWPGNVRQLQNAIDRAKILADDDRIRVENLPPEIVESAHAKPSAQGSIDLETLTREHILETYRLFAGNKARTARALGIARRTLYRLLEKYGIDDQFLAAAGSSD